MRGYGVKDTTPQGIPNVGPNIIPERKYGYPVFDDDGNFIRMAPGNEPKKNDPREHFKRADIEIAGGGMSANWMDVAAQFMMKEIYGDNITGTNVENLTRTDKEIARDKKINIQAIAQQRDRYNQLIQQTQNLVQTGSKNSYKLQREPGVNPKTGLRKPQVEGFLGINPNALSIFRANENGVMTPGGLPQPGPQETIDALEEIGKTGLEYTGNIAGAKTGNPRIGTQIRRGIEAVDAAKKGKPLKAAVSAYEAISPGITIQSKVINSKKSLLQQSAESLVKENKWTGR